MEITNTDSFLAYFDRIRQRTARVAAVIPESQIEWTFREGKFTLGDLVRHIACINRYMYGETVSGRPSAYKECGIELAEGKSNVLKFYDRLQDETTGLIAALTPEQLTGKCETPAGTPITTWKWLRAMIEHEIHHRAQIYTYLALLEVPTPPLYGLTAEQVAERGA